MDITKVVIPAAGLGSRFLPVSKAVPKELLPLLNKPAIQYIMEESMLSQVYNAIFITGKDRQILLDYFDSAHDLESALKERNKIDLLAGVTKITKKMHMTYVRQPEPLGLGHAVLMASQNIQPKEYFGVMLPDDIIMGTTPALAQLATIAAQEKASVIAVQEVPTECLSSYGVISIKKQLTPRLFQVGNLVEKPRTHEAPSNLAIVGRYILSAKIFPALKEVASGATQELQLTDAISLMLKHNEKVFAYKIQGTRYDIGTPIGWLKATIAMGLQHPEFGPQIKDFLSANDLFDSFHFNTVKNISHIRS